VVAIIGILISIAIPNILSWLPNIRLKAAARDLYSSMQKTRMEAVKTNQSWAIVFNSANNTFSICSSPGADANWSTLGDNTVTQTYSFTGSNSGIGYGSGNIVGNNSMVTGDPIPANFVSYANNVLVLNSRGTGNGGYVYLQNQNNTVFAVGTQTSGRILLRRWMGGSWQ
jgi:Tfp pilus assembly protein FimT